MSEGQAVLDGQGLADNVIYGDGPGEVCPRRQGQPHGLPVRAGLVPAPDSEPQPVRQARSLRPQFRIMVQMTVIDSHNMHRFRCLGPGDQMTFTTAGKGWVIGTLLAK